MYVHPEASPSICKKGQNLTRPFKRHGELEFHEIEDTADK